MNEQEVAALLAADLQEHLAWFQVGAIAVGCILMILSSFLFVRAYAALSEVRLLRAQYGVLTGGRSSPHGSSRKATPENINKSGSRRKPMGQRRRTLP